MAFRRIGSRTVLAALLLASPAGAATIGNVTGWSVSGQDASFSISDGSVLRLTILDADTVRVRFTPSGVFTGNVSRAVVFTGWAPESFSTSDLADRVTIQTSELRINVQKVPCVLGFSDSSGNLINTDDPARRIEWDSGYTRVHKATQAGEDYLGLGWRAVGAIRKNGTRFVMRNVPSYGSTDTFYGGIPFWYGLRDGNSYGIFFDDTSWGEIDAGATSSAYMSFQNLGGEIDYYFFYGPGMGKILEQYTELTGRPFMPPKWACGYQQSRWSYTPQSQVLEIANEFRARNIPCDVIYLDIDYMPGGRALTFNGPTFPDPAGMLSTLHGQGFRVVANVSPFLFLDDAKFPTANINGYLIKTAGGGNQYGWHSYWFFVGGAGTGSLCWLDFSRTAARIWWQGEHTSFLDSGIDGIWNDLNEPDELGSAWPADNQYDFDGSPVNHNKTSTQYCLLETDLSWRTLKDHSVNRRPFVLSRGAYAGIQRSAAVWSGDNTSRWEDLALNIPMGLSMSLSGQPHNGHDIGGFFGYPDLNDKPSGELFARWMQAGAFSGFCRGHHDGWGNHDPLRPYVEPWQFGATVENICRDAIGLRYRLMPYLYSLYREAHRSGAPIQRPTVYDFPADAATVSQDYDFMFGPFLLVAPVISAGATSRATYLPAGTDWVDVWTDTTYAGGQTVTVSAPLERVPIFVRSGGILPLGPVMEYADELPTDPLTVEVWPSLTPSSFLLYEDDGLSFDYATGEYAETTLTAQFDGTTLDFGISARSGTYAPPSRHFMVKVHRWSTAVNSVKLNGNPLTQYLSLPSLESAPSGYYYDAAADIVYARFPDSGSAQRLRINEPPAVPFWGIY